MSGAVMALGVAQMASAQAPIEGALAANDPSLTAAPSIEPLGGTGKNRPAFPDYPLASMKAREEGSAIVDMCITTEGKTAFVQMVQSTGFPRLDETTLKWAKAIRWKPAQVGDRPVAVCGHLLRYEWKVAD